MGRAEHWFVWQGWVGVVGLLVVVVVVVVFVVGLLVVQLVWGVRDNPGRIAA